VTHYIQNTVSDFQKKIKEKKELITLLSMPKTENLWFVNIIKNRKTQQRLAKKALIKDSYPSLALPIPM